MTRWSVTTFLAAQIERKAISTEYKIIWVTPPDPVKLGTIMGEIYARGRGLEFVGLVPNGKDSGGAK